jgi:hypothetical protein
MATAVRPHVGDGDIERREAGGGLPDPGQVLHAAEVFVVGVEDLDGKIPHHGIRQQVLHPLYEILVIERGTQAEAPGHREDDGPPLHGAVVGQGALDHAMRGGPELELALGGRGCRSCGASFVSFEGASGPHRALGPYVPSRHAEQGIIALDISTPETLVFANSSVRGGIH